MAGSERLRAVKGSGAVVGRTSTFAGPELRLNVRGRGHYLCRASRELTGGRDPTGGRELIEVPDMGNVAGVARQELATDDADGIEPKFLGQLAGRAPRSMTLRVVLAGLGQEGTVSARQAALEPRKEHTMPVAGQRVGGRYRKDGAARPNVAPRRLCLRSPATFSARAASLEAPCAGNRLSRRRSATDSALGLLPDYPRTARSGR